MINNTPESKLDETIKSTLNNYEAPYDASDWARMESMLDATPKAVSFKWSHVIAVAAGIVVIGGSYLVYNALSTSEKNETETSTTVPVEENTIKETPPPAKSPAVITSPKKEEPAEKPVIATEKITTPVVKEEPAKVSPEPKVLSKEEKKKDKKKNPDKSSGSPIIEPQDKILGMGNEPIFGDMLDSSKGIIGETKEKEETKKAAKAKKDTPVGWNQFMLPNVNADSLKKYREKRDSLKNN